MFQNLKTANHIIFVMRIFGMIFYGLIDYLHTIDGSDLFCGLTKLKTYIIFGRD